MTQARQTLLAGAVLIGIGSVMPWAKIGTLFGEVGIAGTDGDGILTLLIAGVLLLIALTAKGTPGKMFSMVALLGAVAVFIIAGFDALRVGGIVAGFDSDFAQAGLGSGLFVTLLGAVIAGAGASRTVPVDRGGDVRLRNLTGLTYPTEAASSSRETDP
jgi:hypothetical protein